MTATATRCRQCGRLDPLRLKPCHCQTTTMRTKDKDIRLFYEHHTEGHPFAVKGCITCDGEKSWR